MRILRSAALDFAGALAAGFALGSLRVPFLVPHLGARTAERVKLSILLLLLLPWLWARRAARLPPTPA